MTFHSDITNKASGTQLYNVNQMADIFMVCKATIKRWHKESKIPQGFQIGGGGSYRWRAHEIHAFINKGGMDATDADC